MGHSTASRILWMVVTSVTWAMTFDVFYNQHAHHFRLMLILALAVFGTLNVLAPAWPKEDS